MNSRPGGALAIERGEIARREKRPADAERAFTEAVDFFREHGPERDLAHALTRLAQIERDSGRHADALCHQQAAVAIYRSISDRVRMPGSVRHLADILQDMGRHKDAAPYYFEMQTLYKAAQSVPPLEIANAMCSVAIHAEHMGDLHESQRLWREVRDRYAALNDEFLKLRGETANPGVIESDRRLAAVAARIARTEKNSN